MALGLLATAVAHAGTPVPFDAAAQAGLPRATATLGAHGKTLSCEGVWLGDLLARAGLASGKALTGPALATVVIADAADGYRVVFALGEIDPLLGNTPVLVADRCNGAPLAAEDGPTRLVVPGDSRGARSVRQLERLETSVLVRSAR